MPSSSVEFRQIIDTRPSDAVALALRERAPIYVSPEVFAEGTISLIEEQDARETQDFHQFVEEIKASDFVCRKRARTPHRLHVTTSRRLRQTH
ncbi:MAG: bifunctional nuclease family protein [Candidatus Obscuribacterales bacterium]|nr:bifunctional nuclease family protein [Candidatus Obscuribacterales bacterium]